MKINLVMIVKDEERCLERCLKAAASLVDELIIADTGSADRTKEIAAKAGAKVCDYVWTHDFSEARNYSLEQSDADWNLVLDADEYLRPVSRKKLEREIEKNDRRYGRGAWMGAILRFDSYRDENEKDAVSISTSLHARLLPRGVRYSGMIHEQPGEGLPCFLLPIEADHDGYLQEGKGERNLDYIIKAAAREPDNSYYWYQMAATLRGLGRKEESLEWFRRLWKDGTQETSYWTDGILRYLYTLMDLASSSYLEEAKEVVEDVRPALQHRADYWFVCGLFYMKLVLSDTGRYIGYLPEIEKSYLECLRLGERPELEMVAGTGSFKAAYNLGLWYEVSGQTEKAARYYRMAAKEGYAPARDRMRGL